MFVLGRAGAANAKPAHQQQARHEQQAGRRGKRDRKRRRRRRVGVKLRVDDIAVGVIYLLQRQAHPLTGFTRPA